MLSRTSRKVAFAELAGIRKVAFACSRGASNRKVREAALLRVRSFWYMRKDEAPPRRCACGLVSDQCAFRAVQGAVLAEQV